MYERKAQKRSQYGHFNKNREKRSQKHTRKHKNTQTELEHRLRELVSITNLGQCMNSKTLVLQKKNQAFQSTQQIIEQEKPKHIPLIIKDLASFSLGLHKTEKITKIDNMAKTFFSSKWSNCPKQYIANQYKNSFIQKSNIPYYQLLLHKTIAEKFCNSKVSETSLLRWVQQM